MEPLGQILEELQDIQEAAERTAEAESTSPHGAHAGDYYADLRAAVRIETPLDELQDEGIDPVLRRR